MSDPGDPPSGEDAWLGPILAAYARALPADVVLGPGHDAAAVRVAGDTAVVTTDVLVDGVHFEGEHTPPEAVARKALAVNLSDLAAAAAVPVGFVVGAVLPKPADRGLFDALAAGFRAAAEELSCPCLGGDTNVADGPLVLAVTAFGRPGPAGVLGRAGAAPGMHLSVTGPLGGSRTGRHLCFRPRVAEALALAAEGVPRAMMDLSDGLALDLARLCRASGVGACLEAERIPIHDDVQPASGPQALARALGDGEDFELLLAHEPLDGPVRARLEAAGVRLARVGEVREAATGLRLRRAGRETPLPPGGFDHLRPR